MRVQVEAVHVFKGGREMEGGKGWLFARKTQSHSTDRSAEMHAPVSELTHPCVVGFCPHNILLFLLCFVWGRSIHSRSARSCYVHVCFCYRLYMHLNICQCYILITHHHHRTVLRRLVHALYL